MFPISFRFDGWSIDDPQQMSRTIDELVMALADHNRDVMMRVPLPPLYAAGVRYKAQREDVFMDAPAVFHDGHSDCKNLVAWRIAELALQGMPAGATTFWQYRESAKGFPYWFHVVVVRGDGFIEDPSAALGMNSQE